MRRRRRQGRDKERIVDHVAPGVAPGGSSLCHGRSISVLLLNVLDYDFTTII